MLSYTILALLCAPTLPPQAQVPNPPRVRVELQSSQGEVIAGQELQVMLHFNLDPDWHLYWSNPGESGQAPRVRFVGDDVRAPPRLEFPAPERLRETAAVAYGYTDSLALPFKLLVPSDLKVGDRFHGTLRANWLVCNKVRLAEDKQLEFSFPVVASDAQESKYAAAVRAAAEAIPQRRTDWKLAGAGLDGDRLAVNVTLPRDIDVELFHPPQFFAQEPDLVRPSGVQKWTPPAQEGTPGQLFLPVYRGSQLPEVLTGILLLKPLDGGESLTSTVRIPLAKSS